MSANVISEQAIFHYHLFKHLMAWTVLDTHDMMIGFYDLKSFLLFLFEHYHLL